MLGGNCLLIPGYICPSFALWNNLGLAKCFSK